MKVHGIGRFVRDAETRVNGDTTFCSFSLAWDTGFGDKKKTSFVNFNAAGKNAENIAKFFKKGDLIEIKVGELSQRSWEDKNGQKRSTVEVFVQEWGFCGGNKKDEGNNSSSSKSNDSDYLPIDSDDDNSIPF